MVKTLPIFQDSESQPFMLMQTAWASAINPIIKNPVMNGLILGPISLVTGLNKIDHLLGRVIQGWVIIDRDGTATIYRSAPFNDKTLSLTVSANINIKLYVF